MIKLKSYAKINLFLEIKERIDNGYHLIETIFQTINIFDEIIIEKLNEPVFLIKCDNPDVPTGENSLIYQAIEKVMGNTKQGLSVKIKKNVPLAAGLGGGSSNVAAILLGLQRLFNFSFNLKELITIATDLGMDIPYFFVRGTVYGTGRGEILYQLQPIKGPLKLILINPNFQITSKWAYQAYDEEYEKRKQNKEIKQYLHQCSELKLADLKKIAFNSFDATIVKFYPLIKEIKSQLKETGASVVSVSGSGPTVYGIYEDVKTRNDAFYLLKDKYPLVLKANTIRAKNIFCK